MNKLKNCELSNGHFYIIFKNGTQVYHYNNFAYVFTIASDYCKGSKKKIQICHNTDFDELLKNKPRLITTLIPKK